MRDILQFGETAKAFFLINFFYEVGQLQTYCLIIYRSLGKRFFRFFYLQRLSLYFQGQWFQQCHVV